MRIGFWNINSIRSRLPHLLEWLKSSHIDIACLQELKCTEDQMPKMEIEDLGYNIAGAYQKTYNGVAILSKFPLEDIRAGLPGEETDLESRYIEAQVRTDAGFFHVASVYVPNGQEAGSDKFAYKLRFLSRLKCYAETLLQHEEKLVICGDYNVAPRPQDVYDARAMEGAVCFTLQERALLRDITQAGLIDAYRALHPEQMGFTWWDYRAGGFERNLGLRIDHALISPEAADVLQSITVDTSFRAKEKASDHAPVVLEFGNL